MPDVITSIVIIGILLGTLSWSAPKGTGIMTLIASSLIIFLLLCLFSWSMVEIITIAIKLFTGH